MRIDLPPSERITLARGIFGRIAPYYDFLNHTLSLGRDLFWRRAAAARAKVFETGRVLDLASGTGDLARSLAVRHPAARVVGADFCPPMLALARRKIERSGDRIDLVAADALRLPFPDRSFDTVTMAFGIRNIPDRDAAFREMRRVLVPGGRALILELTFPRWSAVQRLYGTYLSRLLPRIGSWVSGDPVAYRYLADSILDFPRPDQVLAQMAAAGLTGGGYIAFTFGVAVLHWAEKPRN